MTRFILLIAIFVVVHTTFAQDRPPNILFIYADDLGYGDVPFNGRKDWQTPNLDRLAREGTVFHRWYTASPVCTPSRGSLLTGKYTIHDACTHLGSVLPSSEVTIVVTAPAEEVVKGTSIVLTLLGMYIMPYPPRTTVLDVIP